LINLIFKGTKKHQFGSYLKLHAVLTGMAHVIPERNVPAFIGPANLIKRT